MSVHLPVFWKLLSGPLSPQRALEPLPSSVRSSHVRQARETCITQQTQVYRIIGCSPSIKDPGPLWGGLDGSMSTPNTHRHAHARAHTYTHIHLHITPQSPYETYPTIFTLFSQKKQLGINPRLLCGKADSKVMFMYLLEHNFH